jgi:hypothetical protein
MKAIAIKGVSTLLSTPEEALRRARYWLGFAPWRHKAAAPAPARKPKPEAGDPSALEPTLYRFILRHSLPAQIYLLVLTLVSFPFLYWSLLLPKTITDGAIKSGKHFPQYILGFELDQISYLFGSRIYKWSLKILYQYFQGTARRTDAAAVPLSAVSAYVAVPAIVFS